MTATVETETETVHIRPSSEVIPMSLWAGDHWSTLAYIETVMVEHGGLFQVGWDPRMRQNRRNFRVMQQQCQRPTRSRATALSQGVVMDRKYQTPLNDGSQVDNHDDWACVQDMAEAGLFVSQHVVPRPITMNEVEPKVRLKLSPKGLALCAALRAHKMTKGGTFKNFRPDPSFHASVDSAKAA